MHEMAVQHVKPLSRQVITWIACCVDDLVTTTAAVKAIIQILVKCGVEQHHPKVHLLITLTVLSSILLNAVGESLWNFSILHAGCTVGGFWRCLRVVARSESGSLGCSAGVRV